MTATKIIIETLLSGQTAFLAPETVYEAIKELADDQATTDGFAHVVAGWAEDAQDRCKALAERVEALEDLDLAKRHIRLHIKEELSEPTPAPDLERIIDKYILWVNTNPRDALRAFAAELGVK